MPLSDLSSPPLRIELSSPPAMRVALMALAVLAALALLLSAAPRWALIAVPLLLGIAWPRRPAHGWHELVLRGDGSAVALDGAGSEIAIVPCMLQRRGWLTVLSVESGGRTHPHLFTPGTLDPDQRRRLQLWFERHVAPDAEPGAAAHV